MPGAPLESMLTFPQDLRGKNGFGVLGLVSTGSERNWLPLNWKVRVELNARGCSVFHGGF